MTRKNTNILTPRAFAKRVVTYTIVSLGLLVFSLGIGIFGYHFIFYGKIRAQAIGPVTRAGYEATSKTFYNTVAAVIIGFSVIFGYTLKNLEDIAQWLFEVISNLSNNCLNRKK